MSEPHCFNENCRIFYSCKNLKHRFNTTECIPIELRGIEAKHKEELKAREQMLREVKNYGR